MNKQRRQEISKIVYWLEKIEKIEDKPLLKTLTNNLENVLSDEEDMFNNIPENLLNSLRASDSEESIDAMNEAIDLLNQAMDEEDVEEFTTKIEEAIIELEVIV